MIFFKHILTFLDKYVMAQSIIKSLRTKSLFFKRKINNSYKFHQIEFKIKSNCSKLKGLIYVLTKPCLMIICDIYMYDNVYIIIKKRSLL